MASNGDGVKPSEKILKQVEYYFGDINFPRDKFLQEEMKKDNGWITLETMLKFNRLAAITKDFELITAALKDSQLIDISDDNTKIRRNPEVPIPENTLEFWQEIKRRTVYLKGFPRESTLDEIAEFVGPYGDVKNIMLRKTKGSKETPKVFKGSVFVTFANTEQAKKLAESKDLKFKNEHELESKMQEEYWASRHGERQEKNELKKQKRKETIEQQNKAHYQKGMVLKLKGLPSGEGKEEITVSQLKQFFQPYGLAVFAVVDGAEATVRFGGSEENVALEAWQKAVAAAENGKVLIEGSETTAAAIEGEEEAQYWKEFSKARVAKRQREQQQRQQQKGARRDQKQGGKRGEWANRKRGAERGGGGQPAEGKKAKRTVFKDDDDDGEGENAKKVEQNGSADKNAREGEETPKAEAAEE